MIYLRRYGLLISENTDIPDKFVEYFEKTYVRKVFYGRNNRVKVSTPLYSIENWNVNQRIKDGTARTNNACEGNNNAMRSNLARTHLNIWSIIDVLKQEESFSRMKMAEWHRGVVPLKRMKYRMIDEYLQDLVRNYDIN